jgi:putative ABC transport system permease protein
MAIVEWLRRLMRRRLDDEDLREEIRAHLAIDADERMADVADDESALPIAVVNNTLAQRFWGGAANAIGKRIRVTGAGDWRTVIGVAADVKYARINEAPRPYIYLPFLQWYRSSMVLHTRGPSAVDVLVEKARAHIASLDVDLPILYARPMAETRGGFILFDLTAAMLFVFGLSGMALAAMGT